MRGSASGGTVTTLASFIVGTEPSDNNNDDLVVNSLYVDAVAHRIYVGVQQADPTNATTAPTSGIKYYDYDPATGALIGNTAGTFLVSDTSSGKPKEAGLFLFDVRDMDLDSSSGTLYFTEYLYTTAYKAEGLFKLSLSNPNVITQVVVQSRFPDDGSNGLITNIEVDSIRGHTYFVTASVRSTIWCSSGR